MVKTLLKLSKIIYSYRRDEQISNNNTISKDYNNKLQSYSLNSLLQNFNKQILK
jgi:hypothetical protein